MIPWRPRSPSPARNVRAVFDKLDDIVRRSLDLEAQMALPEVAADGARSAELAREHATLAPLVAAVLAWQEARTDLAAATELAQAAGLDDAPLWRAEADAVGQRVAQLEERLRDLLVPADPDDGRDVILEIRAAAGGDEAGLFAGELRDMYMAHARAQGWRATVLTESTQAIGGIKEAIIEVVGTGAFADLKHESGVHRVQRVPATESQGRIHTSTASVAVLPAAQEVDVAIDPNDLRVDVFRSSGPGGQSVNTTDSAVRITHLPTAMVVSCQDEKSQHQNRDKAMRILRSRLLSAERDRVAGARADARRTQIGTGDRAEKIRTYNFPQSRITDHRIGFTAHNLSDVLAGNLDELIAALRAAEREARLAAAAAEGGVDD